MELVLPLARYIEQYRYKYLALYHALREAIHAGTLEVGSRLPASRELAELYGVSRGSVSQAYEMLVAEGYLKATVGRGTFVAGLMQGMREKQSGSHAFPLSAWGARIQADLDSELSLAAGSLDLVAKPRISFADGGAALDAKSASDWKSALAYAGRAARAGAKGRNTATADVFGDAGLRAAIAAHLRRSRGIQADPKDICLFSGSMQALALLTQLMLGEGEQAVVEDPGYPGIFRAVRACGGKVLPAAVDASGMVPQEWDARLLFVTPGRQFPTGAVLSASRRRELLAWAQRKEAIIIEDDYDSEFRWGGRPLEPLRALDREGRVVFIGSFTNTMFTSLRIGYALVPPNVAAILRSAKMLYEPTSPALLEQRALARFMVRGDYDKHLRRMRRIYHARYDYLCELLSSGIAGQLFEILPSDTGLHLYAKWRRSPREFADFQRACAYHKVDIRDAVRYQYSSGDPAACFLFPHLDEKELREGVQLMLESWALVQQGRMK
ncbi:GntR family transcriptional regulator/MocR family aminotransferase [Paenibacillus shirakamiensis]|uniref:GntR family transcriptional regulator/MocR family aminotransferase n=1 Tax=Paenibacillus shirakamiensis TaxID=1265935 RepID=A0ABS4JK78_9BACL|nr:PLP-dependent aminotransferase family protein [Paenibacillus shirakamiensis]MBP2002117.1 GntR family transcriptional regulator/MocR family aminotransferase [Paenibacillus shirakamiensis]